MALEVELELEERRAARLLGSLGSKKSCLHEVTLAYLGADAPSSSVSLSTICVNLSVILKTLDYILTLNI